MGKHNGKARSTGGTAVGSALMNRAAKGVNRLANPRARFMHTTDGQGLQSNLEANDLTELMDMAELANRDFTAERGQVIVISNGTVTAKDRVRDQQERLEAEERNAYRLRIPRRPAWTAKMTAEDIDSQERAYFVNWRRELARLEEEERLVLTPFEKNLEVWRQLWRVMERSHIVVQVVDARDPLMYRSQDLEEYCREIHASKASVLLLNKADLLSHSMRTAWADYFDSRSISYMFWSAKAAAEQDTERCNEGNVDDRTRILSGEELIEVFAEKAASAMHESNGSVPKYNVTEASPEGKLMVGLTGYPNVGKSSTINALFGSKKTTVSSTPGKTKHFQTLNITPTLSLVDCPGLVLPRYAASKAEMVAAGVIPIDRLTDVRAPVAVIGERVPRSQLQEVYGISLPRPQPHEDPNRPPTASEILRSLAVARGWCSANGLPDETRAGRTILKDFTAGKLVSALPPPGHETLLDQEQGAQANEGTTEESASQDSPQRDSDGSVSSEDETAPATEQQNAREQGAASGPPLEDLTGADLDLLESIGMSGRKDKPMRAAHKFQKKPKRSKGKRGKDDDGVHIYDGSAMRTGKHGGLVRVS